MASSVINDSMHFNFSIARLSPFHLEWIRARAVSDFLIFFLPIIVKFQSGLFRSFHFKMLLCKESYLKTIDYVLMGTVYQLSSKDRNSHRQHQVIVMPGTFRSCERFTKRHRQKHQPCSTRHPCLDLQMGRLDRWDHVPQPCYWRR